MSRANAGQRQCRLRRHVASSRPPTRPRQRPESLESARVMLARADGAGPRTVALLGSWRRGRAHGGDEPVPDPRQTRIAPGAAAWAAPDGDAAACQGSEPSDYPVRSGIGSGRRARNPALACRATQIRRRYAEADPSSGPSPTRSCAAAGRASMPAPGASMGCRGPGTQWAASACTTR